MVTIPKNSVLANPANLSGPKGLPNTRLSSLADTTVELMDNSVGISFDSSAYSFSDNTDTNFGNEKKDNYQFPFSDHKDKQTNNFKSMLQGIDIPRALSENDQSSPRFSVPYVGLISKAISIYENNARSNNDTSSICGTKFSITL